MANNNDIVFDFDAEQEESLTIFLEKISGLENALILHLDGNLHSDNSALFQKRITKAIGLGFENLIFDCEYLLSVSSSGIGAFTYIKKTVESRGGDIFFSGVKPKVFDTFLLLGFGKFFHFENSLEEAITVFIGDDGNRSDSVFPVIFRCPICSKKIRAKKRGFFRCRLCKSVMLINKDGEPVLE